MDTAKGLREKREELVTEMRAIADKVKTEKRIFNREENETLSNLDKQQEEFLKQAETMERCEHINHLTTEERKEQIISSPWHQGGRPFKTEEERNKAYSGWFLHGTKGCTSEMRRAAERLDIDVGIPSMRFDWIPWESNPIDRKRASEQRSTAGQLVGTNAAGGYTVPIDQSFMSQLDVALKYYGDVLNWATIYDTPTGAALPLIMQDDTANLAETVGEGGAENVLDMAFTKLTLNSYKYDTIVKVSTELETDSIQNLVGEIASQSGERIGRQLNNDTFVGTGSSNNITGVVASIALGFTSTSSLASGPVYTDLTGMYESIDFAYQERPLTGWVFGQGFRGKLRNMVDGNSRPLLMSSLEGIALGLPNSLLDKQYHINPAIAVWAANAKVALFGDLSKICVRRVRGGDMGGLVVTRLAEVYRANGFIGYMTEGRFDAGYKNAGQNPIKYYKAPAT